MSTPQLNLLVLRCADLDLAARFYAALGLDLVVEQHGSGPQHYSARSGAVLLELYPAGEGESARDRVTRSVRLGFVVDDPLVAMEAALAVAGKRRPSAAGEALLLDPDGNAIHLIGAVADGSVAFGYRD